jgi:alkylation response protein AidB-like acyl-CoA dehydrogenase
LDFELTTEQRAWHDAAVEFAKRHLCTDAIERDRAQTFDRDGFTQCAKFGLLGMPVPKEYGGLGLALTDVLAVMEGLGYGGKDAGLLFSVNAHLWTNTIPLVLHGDEEQKRRWLPGLCDGTLIGANGATEADAGSDVFALRTTAKRRGDGYVLDGAKTFVTNAPVADLIVAYATVDPALGPLGVTAFVVERGRRGVTVGKPIEKMGLRTSPMAEVVFDGVEVPATHRLGREGRGVEVFESSMEWERGWKFQAVAARIVDMQLRLETSRLLVYRLGAKKDRGGDATAEAALAKLHVSDSFVKSGLDAVQVFGGYGYTAEYELERELRDAIGATLYSGTSEIQRNVLARALGL